MTTITIRHVAPETRNEIAARAARQGQSLQEYLLGELTRMVEKPAVADVIAGARARTGRSGRVIDRDDLLADRDAERP